MPAIDMAINPLKKLAGQTAIYGLPTIAGRLLNYLLVPLYTRAFLPAEYGVVTEMYAYVAFAFILLTYGMETAFFRFSTQESDRNRVYGTALSSVTVTSFIFVIAGLLFSGNLAQAMGYSGHPEYIRWFVLILATDAITSIPYANLRLENKALKFAFIKIINIATNIGFNLLFIVLIPYLLKNHADSAVTGLFKHIYNPATGIGYIFISNLIASVLTFALLLPDILRKSVKPDPELLKRMLSYAWPLLIFGFAGIVNETFDRIILKHLLPDESNPMAQLGIYGACYKVSILMTLFIQTYRYAAEPFFFDQAAKKDARETYSRMMHLFVIVCLFIFMSIMMYEDIVIRFIGPEYREGRGVIPVLLLANLFLGVFYNLSVWFKLTDNTRKGAAISIIGAGITLILNFLLIPLFGYMGAAWATLICYASMMVISYVWGQKYYRINYNLKGAAIYLLVSLVLYGGFTLIKTDSLPLSLITGTLLLLVFITLVAYREKRFLRRVILKV